MEQIKRASAILIVSLFLAGFFLVPGIGISPMAHLQESSSSTLQSESNNIPSSLSSNRVPRVAIYDEANSTNPVYVSGVFFNNNHTFVVNLLEAAGYEVSLITSADILNHQLTTANFDVFVLDSNFPRENIIDSVKEFWLAGGGILSISDGNMYLAYSGILPRETEGISNGRGVYWKYTPYDNSSLTVRNPITQSYPSGGQILDQYPGGFGITSESYSWTNLTATSIAGDLTKIAVTSSNSDLVRAISLDPSNEGGKVVQIGLPTWYTFYVSYLSNWGPLLVDSVAWLAPKPKARIAFDMSHMPYYGIDSWDPVASHVALYTSWRNLMVSEGYTVDKFYPSAQGNLTAQRLASYDILVEVLPTIDFATAEVAAVQTWVADGHGLLVMGDNTGINSYNMHVNHLLSSLPLNISSSTNAVTGVSAFNNQNHPTTEGVTAGVYFATPGFVNYSGSVAPLCGSAADQIIVAAYQHVSGRIILASDINWMEDAYFPTHSNKQFSSNIIDWLSVENGDILIYTVNLAPNPFKSPLALALNQLGLHFYLTNSSVYTNISLWYQEWSLVVIAESNYDASSIYSSLKEYIDQGGRVLMEAWNLDAYPTSPLWATMGAQFVHDWQHAAPVYIWQTGHPIFNTPVQYNAPTLNLTAFSDQGDRVSVFDNATALAGNSTTPSENGSTIVLRNDGQTLLNTFIIDGLRGDADDSAYVDAFEIWMNEVSFMMRPTIDSPSDFSYEAGSTGHSITWNPSSYSPASYAVDVNGTPEVSGDWTGTSTTYSVDGLDLGVYVVTLTVTDKNGETASDSVTVTVVDTTSPVLLASPNNLQYEEGTAVHLLNWTYSDLLPDSYWLLIDSETVESGNWDGSMISVNVGGLSAGTYSVTIAVNDTSGNTATDMVQLTVTAPPTTTTTTTATTTTTTPTETGSTSQPPSWGDNTTWILMIIAAIAVVVIIVVIVSRRRK